MLQLSTFHGCAVLKKNKTKHWLLIINSGFCLSLAVKRITKGSGGHVMPNYKQVPAPGAGIPPYKQAGPSCWCVSLCAVCMAGHGRCASRTIFLSHLYWDGKYEKHLFFLCAPLWVGVSSKANLSNESFYLCYDSGDLRWLQKPFHVISYLIFHILL